MQITAFGHVPIPADAGRRCDCGGWLAVVPGTVSCDEGNGAAMVNLTCTSCPLQSVHYWTLSDRDYQAAFGHAFDDPRDDDADTDDVYEDDDVYDDAYGYDARWR